MDMPDKLYVQHDEDEMAFVSGIGWSFGTKEGCDYVKADLAQSLADALDGIHRQAEFFIQDGISDAVKDNTLRQIEIIARAALANYRKGE